MKYAWEVPYVVALLQTDEELMHTALYEAIAATEQRRLSPVNAAEDIALVSAEAGMQMLIAEITAKYD
jgi:hypothetical protein